MAIATTEKPIVSTGPVPDLLLDCYTMFFRDNRSNALVSKTFRCKGGLTAARLRAEKHCETMQYRLHWVQPLVSDLSKEEDYHLGREGTPA